MHRALLLAAALIVFMGTAPAQTAHGGTPFDKVTAWVDEGCEWFATLSGWRWLHPAPPPPGTTHQYPQVPLGWKQERKQPPASKPHNVTRETGTGGLPASGSSWSGTWPGFRSF